METRSCVVRKLRLRVNDCISTVLDAETAIAVSIAATFPRDKKPLLEILLNYKLSKIAISKCNDLSIKKAEWKILFEKNGASSTNGASFILNNQQLSKHTNLLESALKCSVTEREAQLAWKTPLTRLSCYMALYTDTPEDLISEVLGVVVIADKRRLDDICSNIEQIETDHLLLCNVLLYAAKLILAI